MRLLRLQDVEMGPGDRVFRHSRLRALIVWLAGFAATSAFFYHAYVAKWPPGYFFGSFLGIHSPEIAQPRRATEATPRTGYPRPDHHGSVRRPHSLRVQLRRSKSEGGFNAGK
jgi:hypothetical protein